MAAYDPNDGTVDEVNAYLAEHPDEAEAVLAAEQTGQARKGILEGPHATQADPEPDPGTGDPEPSAQAQIAAQDDQRPAEILEQANTDGFLGERYDQTPLDAYTLQGVTSDDEAAKADQSPHSPTADGPGAPVGDDAATALREQDQVTEPPSDDDQES